MSLKIYNSLTKKIEPFETLRKNEVSMYVCGITPDAETHLGHAFTYITFDAMVRYLKFLGNNVRYVQNVTDVDDDILERSKKAGKDWKEFGDHWTQSFLSNMEKLGWQVPQPYVKATDSIPTIIKIVSGLVDGGLAYVAEGNVYFEVSKFGSYGNLSGYDRRKMIELEPERGANPDDPNKRDPLDFILWQSSKSGEPSWDSPWGPGRPGWHIECSSMIHENLGEQIDIHGGGEDLIYPHHESEIAQSESFTGRAPFANYFMHTSYVRYKGEKMSKSLGNLIMVSDLLEKCTPNAIRWEILSHHYREQWEFYDSDPDTCATKCKTLEEIVKNMSEEDIPPDKEFLEALDDDFNTPKALEYLIEAKPKSLKTSLKLLGFQL